MTDGSLDYLLQAAHDSASVLAVSEPSARRALLTSLAGMLDVHAEELAVLADVETSLGRPRLIGEIARTSGQLRHFADVIADGAYLAAVIDRAEATASPPRPDLRRVNQPVGPVLVYAASNFPFAFSVLGGDTASALAAGCPVIVKAHPAHPALSVAVAELAADVVSGLDLPAGVFALVEGEEAGVTALRDARVKACGFTGSNRGGRALFDIASGRPDPIPFFGELGSINPVVVTANAARLRGAEIAAGYVASFTLGHGQLCTKPGLLLVPHGSDLPAKIAAMVAEVPAARLLDGRIRDQFVEGVCRLAGHTATSTLASGGPVTSSHDDAAVASVYLTTAAAIADDPTLLDEHFGPVSVIATYRDDAELRRAVAAVEGALTATIHSDGDLDADLVDDLTRRAGRVIFDQWPTGVAVTWAMHHGGPWPATTASAHTSVGAAAITRWVRPVCYQNAPPTALPPPLRDDNPWNIPQRVSTPR